MSDAVRNGRRWERFAVLELIEAGLGRPGERGRLGLTVAGLLLGLPGRRFLDLTLDQGGLETQDVRIAGLDGTPRRGDPPTGLSQTVALAGQGREERQGRLPIGATSMIVLQAPDLVRKILGEGGQLPLDPHDLRAVTLREPGAGDRPGQLDESIRDLETSGLVALDLLDERHQVPPIVLSQAGHEVELANQRLPLFFPAPRFGLRPVKFAAPVDRLADDREHDVEFSEPRPIARDRLGIGHHLLGVVELPARLDAPDGEAEPGLGLRLDADTPLPLGLGGSAGRLGGTEPVSGRLDDGRRHSEAAELGAQGLGQGLLLLPPLVGPPGQVLIARQVHDAGEDLVPLPGQRAEQSLGFPLHEQDGRRERFIGQPDVLLDPTFQTRVGVGLGHRGPAAGAALVRLEPEDLALGPAVATEAPPDPIAIGPEVEVEDDREFGGVRVDQAGRVSPAAPVGAEEGEGHGVEDRRLAAAVAAGEDPEVAAVEVDDLFVSIAEEPVERDPSRDHGRASAIRISAAARMASAFGWPSRRLRR